MHPSYSDITSRIEEEPSWWDSNGVPRYGPFEPEALGVYDDAAVLVLIGCQACERQFLIGIGSSGSSRYETHLLLQAFTGTKSQGESPNADEWLAHISESFHYGDPPRHGCVGDTMNCIDLELLQAWRQRRGFKEWVDKGRWERVSRYERHYDLPDWADERGKRE